MPVINGQKFACDSCVRGHRVSNCNHEDRQLKLIPPKGRPVKQCEHCRTARKSKSHHAKCDCGNKKEKKVKKEAESPPMSAQEMPSPVHAASPSHDYSCSCNEGESCICGSKPEGAEIRQVRRTPQSVKTRPSLTSSNSETKLMIITNGHHAPCHRNNNLAHTSGTPYPTRKIKRPQTFHGPPSSGAITEVQSPNLAYAVDDLNLDHQATKGLIMSNSNASFSEENLTSPSYDNRWTFDPISENDNRLSFDFTPYNTSVNMPWRELSPTRAERAFPPLQALGTSPNFDCPSHTFQPSDLPLVSPQAATFSQAFTLDDSAYAHAPGLTSNSSTRSENEFWGDASNSDNAFPTSHWSDTIQVRSNSSSSALDHWTLDNGNELTSVSMAPSSSALYNEPKSGLALYNDVSTSSFDMSSEEDAWLGTIGTEPPTNNSQELSSYLWDTQNFL